MSSCEEIVQRRRNQLLQTAFLILALIVLLQRMHKVLEESIPTAADDERRGCGARLRGENVVEQPRQRQRIQHRRRKGHCRTCQMCCYSAAES